MLVKFHSDDPNDLGTLVPHDINRDLLEFIRKDNCSTRFITAFYIEHQGGNRNMWPYEIGYIQKSQSQILQIRAQINSRPFDPYLYAWEHVFCVMPSAQRNRTKGSGWISPDAHDIIRHPEYKNTWYSGDVIEFIAKHEASQPDPACNTTAES